MSNADAAVAASVDFVIGDQQTSFLSSSSSRTKKGVVAARHCWPTGLDQTLKLFVKSFSKIIAMGNAEASPMIFFLRSFLQSRERQSCCCSQFPLLPTWYWTERTRRKWRPSRRWPYGHFSVLRLTEREKTRRSSSSSPSRSVDEQVKIIERSEGKVWT